MVGLLLLSAGPCKAGGLAKPGRSLESLPDRCQPCPVTEKSPGLETRDTWTRCRPSPSPAGSGGSGHGALLLFSRLRQALAWEERAWAGLQLRRLRSLEKKSPVFHPRGFWVTIKDKSLVFSSRDLLTQGERHGIGLQLQQPLGTDKGKSLVFSSRRLRSQIRTSH
ncbi:hypothetical protein NDU88_000699 [Pleurodeles waltl]|uniref:Uncharacterized protein n=1 Tax=Pleurodeles waltl TaxID=8319 RepID=A0AAV7NC41_PLEWA|nr:hypothetical protein NDU88_000699 [Pleurodeles waltl]